MRHTKLTRIVLTAFLVTAGVGTSVVSAQTTSAVPLTTDTVIHIDRNFLINTDRIISSEQGEKLPQIDLKTDTIFRVDITGKASIDGPEALNNRLARERAEVMRKILLENYPINPDSIYTTHIGEDWDMFRDLVVADEAIPNRGRILEIIDSKATPATKEMRIKRLGRETWRYLALNILPQMRYAAVAMHIQRTLPPPPAPPVPEFTPVYIGPDTMAWEEEEVVVVEATQPRDDWYRKMYIKTNAPAWALLWQNLAVEFDLAKHWSFALPVYWSPYNYGKQTLKFRTLTLMPEFRYWPKADNTGFFINAHFGMGYYNYAGGGDHRYQDHRGKTPALGGGLGIGYRFYFCKNHRWTIEVAAGAGAYKLDYDIFQNTPSTKHGMLIGRRQRTIFCLDQAAVTFSYSFGLRKKQSE